MKIIIGSSDNCVENCHFTCISDDNYFPHTNIQTDIFYNYLSVLSFMENSPVKKCSNDLTAKER